MVRSVPILSLERTLPLFILLLIPLAQASTPLAPAALNTEPVDDGTLLEWSIEGDADATMLVRHLDDATTETVELPGDASSYIDAADPSIVAYTVTYTTSGEASLQSNPGLPYPHCMRLVETSPPGLPYACHCPHPIVGFFVCNRVPIWS